MFLWTILKDEKWNNNYQKIDLENVGGLYVFEAHEDTSNSGVDNLDP